MSLLRGSSDLRLCDPTHRAIGRTGGGRGGRGWGVVRVAGRSMEPALRPGDLLVVRRGAAVRPGDVVVATFLARPGVLAVKRVVQRAGDGWWLAGDNAAATDDSRSYGPVADDEVV